MRLADSYYGSPRWSGEFLDCSMPMTFDSYSSCGYGCLYCFAFFQRSISFGKQSYLKNEGRPVNIAGVKRIFTEPESSGFWPYVKRRLAMQWGGMSDPFCRHERQQEVGLDLIRFFREIEYPVSFSTKGTWWLNDDRYLEAFRGAKHFHVKVSIITLEEEKARGIERGCPSSLERLKAIGKLKELGIGGVTLRLRPFIIGVSDQTCEELIRAAAERGADSLSTEFLCIESRCPMARDRYVELGKYAGFDVQALYRKVSNSRSGYMRLNRSIKRPFVDRMEAACAANSLRFYVSDAHFKERCANGSCCGLPPSWNYTRHQYTEALLVAKTAGQVSFSEVYDGCDYLGADFQNFVHTRGAEQRAKFSGMSGLDYARFQWNAVNSARSPYKYFGGVLVPHGRDAKGDVVYLYAQADKPTR